MKRLKHLGAYGLILNYDEILLIKKHGGPYDGKLDLPGGTIEFGENPEQALCRELKEEVGINVTSYSLFDANSICFEWVREEELESLHHLGIFYKVNSYENEVIENIDIDSVNDDSMGASFYKISSLRKDDLSKIAVLEINKLGYELK